MPGLFDPLHVGAIEASNRIWMAPLTRARGTKDFVPQPIMAEYYGQRAAAGLIISEATHISLEGSGWPYAPGIWNEQQVEGWKPVTKAVHDKGGKIVLQLWHMGRTTHTKTSGVHPVAPSAITCPEHHFHTYEGNLPPEQPRELTKDDIKRIVGDYAHAAKNAIKAGFDGVQIHGANGYLIDEFLKTSSNKRTDEYGGSSENRVRFLREVVESVVNAVGADRTGIRLSPNASTMGAEYEDGNPEPDTRLAAKIFEEFKIAFVELREPGPQGTFGASTQPKQRGVIREEYKGVLVTNQDLTPDDAKQLVEEGTVDAVAFGRPYIYNPDLFERIENSYPLATGDMTGWYVPDDKFPREKGYIDYPRYSA